ncbi:MAG: 50S ribosomal protein L2 [Candidatus Portnoybacteria bacterium CG10_big_fil_rev_8_21_14_0_10_44_7]|uniref:Large ribosomal subunit protein uL2 n=1 Tax=Candidatus Portnoybacteria bacterium CG10_big_fil_rev_8_21_14_0_10_44_7 TaxID=1974816 RepID=A0A2M8KIU5_9BACT|nr:MAG: 50S ribosomal protein L2 [Candidatus Portnoybacteria bacterium CG10_big_fil_rev_8_21_14_0_10_44_7]
MALKRKKPNTPGQRGTILIDYAGLTKKKPEKKLLRKKTRLGGRSGATGRITTRHKGGGAKKKYRVIDFKREKIDIPAKVRALEYDPNRTCFIALLAYTDGEKRYILASEGLQVGAEVISSPRAAVKVGNRLPLKKVPPGTTVHDIELYPQSGSRIVRAAGAGALVMSHDKGYVQLKLPSTEIRLIKETCLATVGAVSNSEHNLEVLGKAGRQRWRGVRPTVRGSAMNPVDHPHGGGEGRSGIGLRRGPKTPWGKQALGVKTRRRKKPSSKFILQRRKKKKRK